MSNDPNVSMGGGSFDFDAEHRRGGPNGPGRPGGPGGNRPGGPGGPGGSWNNGPGGRGPNGPGGPGGPGRPGGGSGRSGRKFGCGTIVALVVVLLLIGLLIQSCSGGSGNADCGDYNLENGQYVSAPNAGDYEKNGDSYDYVGCDTSRSGGGGFFFFPFFFGGGGGGTGSNYGDGSGFRGGGPGSGK